MINITIWKNQNANYKCFEVIGHAEFAEFGNDIVCAGVSTLVINTINSIEKFTTDSITVHTEEDSGLIRCVFSDSPSKEANLLLDSMVLGLEGIQNDYSKEYIKLIFKEV